MKRIHLFEFEDFQWFPTFLRNYMTDFLQFLSNRFDLYRDIEPLLSEALEQSGGQTIVDLASGGGGGLLKLSKHLKARHPQLKIILTDFYPNTEAFKRTAALSPVFAYSEQSVNAMDVPADLKGLRTQFLSLHHFRPEAAVKILQNAVDSNTPIALFESQQRDLRSLASMLFSPVSVLLFTPFIRPFRIGRILFTYLLPLVPLFVAWDGIVSALRTYSVKEMNRLILRVEGYERYKWKVGVQKRGPVVVPYLIGYPR